MSILSLFESDKVNFNSCIISDNKNISGCLIDVSDCNVTFDGCTIRNNAKAAGYAENTWFIHTYSNMPSNLFFKNSEISNNKFDLLKNEFISATFINCKKSENGFKVE